MRRESLSLLVNNIKLPVSASVKEAFSVARGRLKRIGIHTCEDDCSIFRRSIDARKKENIFILLLIFLIISSKAVRDSLWCPCFHSNCAR